MKLGLLPLFIPEQALQNPEALVFSRLSFFSAILLSELKAFLGHKLPDVHCQTLLTLPDVLKYQPDVVLILSNSCDFAGVADWADNLKAALMCPVWLAGSHISHLPQSLPDTVDLGILGELELPVLQLLTLAFQAGGAHALTPQMYRKVPGVIYQQQGRMYSGAPAQELPELRAFPTPDLSAFQVLPAYFSAALRTARVNDSIFAQMAFPLTRKPRLYSVDYICDSMVNIVHHYQRYLSQCRLSPQVFRQVCSVFITDYQFVLQQKRLALIVEKMRALYLHHVCFLTVHMPVRAVTEETLLLLKSVNLQKVILSFGPFEHQEPLLPPCTAADLDRALALLKRFRVGVIGHFFVNPEAKTSRQQIFATYVYLKANSFLFESLSHTVLGATPGLSLWEATAAQRKQRYSHWQQYPWASLSWEKLKPALPLAHKHLDKDFFQAVEKALNMLPTKPFVPPSHQEAILQNQAELVKAFAETYLFPEARILELVVDDTLALKPFLKDYHDIYQMHVKHGQLQGTLPQPVDVLVLVASIQSLRDPEKALRHALMGLKPGGVIYLSVLNPMYIGFIAQVLKWPARQSLTGYQVLKWFTDTTLINLLLGLGLELVHFKHVPASNIEQWRPTVEKLAKQFEQFGMQRISQYALYVQEINVLARKP